VRLTLHGYWRSTTAYRVRIALAVKGVAYEQVTHDLRTGAQHVPEYRTLNPQGLVPALETDDAVLTQSPAILEWIDEVYPVASLRFERPCDRPRDGRDDRMRYPSGEQPPHP
jgi:maleylpyruvate isomerase